MQNSLGDEAGNSVILPSHYVAISVKMKFHDSAFIGRSREKPNGLDAWQLLCDSSLLY